jgi:hypothetical protein
MYLISFVFISILFFIEFATQKADIILEAKPTEAMLKDMEIFKGKYDKL